MRFGDEKNWQGDLVRFARNYCTYLPIQLLLSGIGLSSVIFFLYRTYETSHTVESQQGFIAFSSISFVFFAITYVLSVLAARQALHFIFSRPGIAAVGSMLPILDFVIISTPLGLFIKSWIGFMRVVRLLYVLEMMRYRDVVGFHLQPHDTTSKLQQHDLMYQLASSILSILLYIFLASGLVYAVSVIHTNAFNQPLQWHDALYFVVTTGLIEINIICFSF